MADRRNFLKFLSAAAVGILIGLSFPAKGKEFFVRIFFNEKPTYESLRAQTIWMFVRAAEERGYANIGKLKYHPVVWNEKHNAWDVTVSAILS